MGFFSNGRSLISRVHLVLELVTKRIPMQFVTLVNSMTSDTTMTAKRSFFLVELAFSTIVIPRCFSSGE
jgi:hypothetical protein